jgi:alpha-methylacyl-CoA racemase
VRVSAGGPLAGVKVVELAGIGPVPFCATLLADLGAEVVRVDRVSHVHAPVDDTALRRGRRSVALDLKDPAARDLVRTLVAGSDVLLEGFRPGVMERLGLGPDACLAENPRLVYGRMTGWGQEGPLSGTAGHDINYLALAGALSHLGRRSAPPAPPLNLVADFGGGAMLLAVGVLAALTARSTSGQGQVVDAAMVDGVASLMGLFAGMQADGSWTPQREANLLDGGAYFYDTYETADGRFLAVGAIEVEFHDELIRRLGLDLGDFSDHRDPSTWPARRTVLAERIRGRTLAHWQRVFDGSDSCATPVLTLEEAAQHPHLRARRTWVDDGGALAASPAPRFSSTPCLDVAAGCVPGDCTRSVLAELGADPVLVDALVRRGVAADAGDPLSYTTTSTVLRRLQRLNVSVTRSVDTDGPFTCLVGPSGQRVVVRPARLQPHAVAALLRVLGVDPAEFADMA